ncbi:MAG: hypothetical protein AAF290_16810 [Pseudomonadota bacterium]
MRRQQFLYSWHPGPILLAFFSLALLALPARAHDVHEHTAGHGHDPVPETGADHHATPRSLLQAFRTTGDDAHLDHAWSLIETRLRPGSSNPEMLIDAALIAQARHQFDRALGLTRNALKLDSRNDQAWLLLASIHLVTGQTEMASEACDELTRVPWIVMVGCEARVAHASGMGAKVRASFERALLVMDEARIGAGTSAWALSIAGDLAVAGNDAGAAIGFFRRSLSLVENTQVRSALVDVLLANDRLAGARDALDAGSEALPLGVRRLILAKRQDRIADMTDRVAAFDRRFQEWIAAEDWLHAREMARFYLDVLENPALAKKLIKINIESQKEYEDQLLLRRIS